MGFCDDGTQIPTVGTFACDVSLEECMYLLTPPNRGSQFMPKSWTCILQVKRSVLHFVAQSGQHWHKHYHQAQDRRTDSSDNAAESFVNNLGLTDSRSMVHPRFSTKNSHAVRGMCFQLRKWFLCRWAKKRQTTSTRCWRSSEMRWTRRRFSVAWAKTVAAQKAGPRNG